MKEQQDIFGQPISNTHIRALSWKQPYAGLMLFNKIETRTWFTNYRGLVLICSSQKRYSESDVCYMSGPQASRIASIEERNPDLFVNGKAIAVARLTDCRLMKRADEEACYVKYRPGLWCHIYADVTPIDTFDFKGAQLWGKVGKSDFEKIINYFKEKNGASKISSQEGR